MKKILYVLIIAAVAMSAGFVLNVEKAEAVPSFARNMGLGCGSCHYNFPLLNSFGRAFLRQGYDAGEENDLDEMTSIQSIFPIGTVLYLRPIDKRFNRKRTSPGATDKDKQLRLRAAHEIEIFMAGRYSDYSYWVEIEGEDEAIGGLGGMAMDTVMAYAGWHPMPEFNIKIGMLPPYAPDGVNTLTRMGPEPQAPWNSGGFTLGDSQTVMIYGETGGLIYSGAWHSIENDGTTSVWETNDARSYSFRLAYGQDFNDANISFGGYFTHVEENIWTGGKRASDRNRRNHYGLDAQLESGGLLANLLFGNTSYDSGDWVDDDSDWGISMALEYFLQNDSGMPTTGVSVYIDRYTTNNGDDDYTDVGVYLSHYFRGNAKVIVGWSGNMDAPDRYVDKESRFRVQFVLGI